MTIPSRPAPPPPQPTSRTNQNAAQNLNKFALKPPPSAGNHNSNLRHTKTSKLESDQGNSSSFNFWGTTNRYESIPVTKTSSDSQQQRVTRNKKPPPPRPPPPRISPNLSLNDAVLKKPGPPQSVNVLSDFFKKKKSGIIKRPPPKFPQQLVPALYVKPPQSTTSLRSQDNDVQLISFDSPPSSPTLTQKSNSDCVSVDSFSSDSNFSSPNNGSTSQPESGFEDDFSSPLDPWEAIVSEPFGDRNRPLVNDLRVTQPVRNLQAIHNSQVDNVLCNGKSLLPPAPTLTMPTIIKPRNTSHNTRNTSPVYSGPVRTTASGIYESTKTVEAGYLQDALTSLPMPACPPPPAPPVANVGEILGAASVQLDALDLADEIEMDGPSYGIALYDFEGVEDEDLSFKQNEKIYLLQRLNEEWYLGRNRRGCEGMFPANYVDVKVPLKATGAVNQKRPAMPAPSHNANRVRALYKFTPETAEDLPLEVNDVVTVLYRINAEWLYGEVGNKQGQFPANFVDHVPDNLP